MILTRRPALRDATHVALDSATTERLLRLGATRVVRASDRLLIGPSRRDPSEHAGTRAAWWRSSETWDRLYSPDVRWQPPVLVWASRSVHDRINLWRVLSWVRQVGRSSRDVFIIELDPIASSSTPEEPIPPYDCTLSVADHSDDVLLKQFETAQPWPITRYNSAIALWERYVDTNPLRFARSCVRGLRGVPELGALWAFLSSLFPRKAPDGALRLSRLDQLLLGLLSAEWQTPVGVFAHKSEAGVALRQLLSCTGDLFLPRRLDQWAAHDSSGAVERVAGPKPPDYPLLSSSYRITAKGVHLRDSGLDKLADAPGLPVAGAEAYATSAPWIVREDGRLTQLGRGCAQKL
ncbi:MAG: hypothetical protein IPK82_08170 [Polyangiaceae bacterium]|nr:hypothetical protein [Polyangiaceae bacterium]